MTSSRFPSFGPDVQKDSDELRPANRGERRGAAAESSPQLVQFAGSAAVATAFPGEAQAGRPYGVFVPQNYEPNYAYPLVIWLHDAGGSERDIVEVLPQISKRNYVGLSLRGVLTSGRTDGYCWPLSDSPRSAMLESLYASVRRLRRDLHVHTERVFLAGAGEGATLAWELFLHRPEWFAGIAALGGQFPWRRHALIHFRELRGRHVFLGAEAKDKASVRRAEEVGRLLYSAGLEVAVRCAAGGRSRPRALFREIDCWIMRAIGGCL